MNNDRKGYLNYLEKGYMNRDISIGKQHDAPGDRAGPSGLPTVRPTRRVTIFFREPLPKYP